MTGQSDQGNLVGITLGQYEIVELIGEGGMATVYKAWQPSLRRYVALKVLAPHLADDAEFVKRFRQEAVSAANLKHTHIVTIHDVGTADGYHYIAMEFIEGSSLEEHIRSGQAFTPEQAVDVISQVGSALDYAHQRGFIHRDIKPANVLIDESGRAVLTDFGIVKALSGSGVTSPLTQAGTIFGTPQYMSPEQVKDEPLDHRSDLYSLGIVCYEMLSGQAPFDGTTTHSILYAQVNNPPPPLREFADLDVPAQVEAVVNKMLAKERDARYGSAGEFARDLAQAVSGVWPAGLGGKTSVVGQMGTGTAKIGGTPPGMPSPTVRQPAGPPTPPATVWQQPGPPTPAPTAAPARRRRWPVVLGVAVLGLGAVLILAVVGVLVLSPWYPLRSARTALDAGDYTTAVEKYSQALDRDADNDEAIDGLLQTAANLAQTGQFSAAISAYETVLQAEPSSVQALRGLGQTYAAQEEWGDAAAWYEKWTQVAPEDGGAFVALADARFNLGQYERAAADYERALALGTDAAEVDENLGLAYYELAQYDEAVEHLQNAVNRNPGDSRLQPALGLTYFELDRYEEAVGYLQDAVSRNPEDFQLQRALGVSLYDQGQPDQALEHLNKAVELGADRPGEELMDVYYALGGSTFAQQDYERSIDFYQRAQELDPEGQAVWAGEARANLDEAYSKLAQQVMGEAVLDLDFSNMVTEGEETYAVAQTGQRVKIEGAVHLVGGLREGTQALVVEEGTTNIVTNPSFETNLTSWLTANGGMWVCDNMHSKYGEHCLKGVTTDGAYAKVYILSGLTGGQELTVSVWMLSEGDSVRFYVSDVDYNNKMYSDSVTSRTWMREIAQKTVPADGSIKIVLYVDGGGTGYWDGVQAEANRSYATTYCDGSLGAGYIWNGVPHASTSTRKKSDVSLNASDIDLSEGGISIWFQMPYDAGTSGLSVTRGLFRWWDAYNTESFYVQFASDLSGLQVIAYSGGSRQCGISGDLSASKSGDWHHAVVTFDDSGSGEVKLYLDGELRATDTSYTAPSISSRTAHLGNVTARFGGAIGEFVIFDSVLTAEHVIALYRRDAPLADTGAFDKLVMAAMSTPPVLDLSHFTAMLHRVTPIWAFPAGAALSTPMWE